MKKRKQFRHRMRQRISLADRMAVDYVLQKRAQKPVHSTRGREGEEAPMRRVRRAEEAGQGMLRWRCELGEPIEE